MVSQELQCIEKGVSSLAVFYYTPRAYPLVLVVCTAFNTRLDAVYRAILTYKQGKSTTQVFYKPSPVEHETFSVIVNPDEYKRWSEGDKTIPLVEVVDC